MQHLNLSSLNLPLSSSSTTSRELLRNSRLVVDEDDLKWVTNKGEILLLLKLFHNKNSYKPLGFQKLSISSEIQNYALRHRDGLKGKRVNDLWLAQWGQETNYCLGNPLQVQDRSGLVPRPSVIERRPFDPFKYHLATLWFFPAHVHYVGRFPCDVDPIWIRFLLGPDVGKILKEKHCPTV